MSYAQKLKDRLARYKRERLGVFDDGLAIRTGRPHAHILPQSLQRLNVLEQIRREFWTHAELTGLERRLHSDFHHLNSSQAAGFNLLFPFLSGKPPLGDPLLDAIGVEVRPIHSWEFESIPDQVEGTNVDCLIQFIDSRAFVEIKLTEGEFGTCKDDPEHRRKLESVYRPRLEKKVVESALTPEVFFRSYQLFRYVSLLNEGDVLALLLPRANTQLWVAAHQFIQNNLTAAAGRSVKVVAIEDLLANLKTAKGVDSPQIRSILDQLSEKYLLDFETAPPDHSAAQLNGRQRELGRSPNQAMIEALDRIRGIRSGMNPGPAGPDYLSEARAGAVYGLRDD